MSALESPNVDRAEPPLPKIYIASPLTGLSDIAQRQIASDVLTVKNAINAETHLDRIDHETWAVCLYAPIDHTAPWRGTDGLAPHQIYKRNLAEVHQSDAVVILAEGGGSAGVGQELEWGTRLGLPILFLSADDRISRQITGAPAFISPQTYNKNPDTLTDHVKNFLRRWKPVILDGPRRRESCTLRFEPITLRLRAAWQNCTNPTNVAAQARVSPEYLELALGDPIYVSTMPVETLITVAHELSVPLQGLDHGLAFTIPASALRPLMTAAADDGWSDAEIDALLQLGRAALNSGDPLDLRTLDGWRQLRERLP